MGDEAHDDLLTVLVACDAAVVLSGYDSDLYNGWLEGRKGWRRVEETFPVDSSHGETKNTRVECLWIKEHD